MAEKKNEEPTTGITWNQSAPVSAPTPEQERRMLIRRNDWDRWTKKLNRVKNQSTRFDVIYSFLFGFSASSFIALVTSLSQPKIAMWVIVTYAVSIALGLVLGLIVVYIDKALKQVAQSTVKEVVEDMEEIQKSVS